jgi:hypothetical protein
MGVRSLRIAVTALLLVGALAIAGCAPKPLWVMRPVLTEDMVAALLGLRAEQAILRDILASEIPEVPIRVRLRPCCAFGTGLRTSLGEVPVPGVKLKNIIALEDLGPHAYDSGLLAVQGSFGEFVSSENNGLIYTCRGGFIDTAHVRDYADWMIFLASAVARSLETGTEIEFPSEGGQRRVILEPADPELLARFGRLRLTLPLAQWLTFQLSIWHEIATWFGWSSMEIFPERASAFSPEDLFSNLLGIRLSLGLIRVRGGTTDLLYSHNLDRWTRAALEQLGAVSQEAGVAAAELVDGIWWDSSRRLPDAALVRRRNMEIGSEIEPWVLSRAGSWDAVEAWLGAHCGGEVTAASLPNPDSLHGVRFRDLARLEIEVGEKIAPSFPFPRPDSRVVTQEDFPQIVDAIRRLSEEEFGPGAARPERDAAAPRADRP